VDSCVHISFSSVIGFGDSLSDVGTYARATSVTHDDAPPFVGGRFTTNSASSTVWIENVASQLGLVIAPATTRCAQCTGYAQGSARVTTPMNESGPAILGLSSVPVVTQIATHLARSNDTFSSTDLVFVWAGKSDVVVQMNTWLATAESIIASIRAKTLTSDDGVAMYDAATAFARDAVAQAATELAGYVKDLIVGKGAQYVFVVGLFDLSITPYGTSLDDSTMLSTLSTVFNMQLASEFETTSALETTTTFTDAVVQYVDPSGLLANDAPAYFDDVNTPACNASKISAFVGEPLTTAWSLWCNTMSPYDDLVESADATTWLWADDIHPTTGGHRFLSDAMWNQVQGTLGWVDAR